MPRGKSFIKKKKMFYDAIDRMRRNNLIIVRDFNNICIKYIFRGDTIEKAERVAHVNGATRTAPGEVKTRGRDGRRRGENRKTREEKRGRREEEKNPNEK